MDADGTLAGDASGTPDERWSVCASSWVDTSGFGWMRRPYAGRVERQVRLFIRKLLLRMRPAGRNDRASAAVNRAGIRCDRTSGASHSPAGVGARPPVRDGQHVRQTQRATRRSEVAARLPELAAGVDARPADRASRTAGTAAPTAGACYCASVRGHLSSSQTQRMPRPNDVAAGTEPAAGGSRSQDGRPLLTRGGSRSDQRAVLASRRS